MKTLSTFVMLGLASTAFAQDAQPVSPAKPALLQAFMETAVERGLFRGVIVVVESGDVIFEFAHGDARPGVRPTTVESSFYLASLSKQFTATAIMLLYEQGRLAFDDPVSKHLPQLPEWANKVTIFHLLTNTSGLGNYLDADLPTTGLTNDLVMEHISALPDTEYRPGERYHYSNSGYMLLGRIVERVSEMSFREFTTQHIFVPLGMNSSVFFDETQPDVPDRVIGYDRFGRLSDLTLFTNGAGGMFSSAPDLVKWHNAIFDATLLKKETLNRAFSATELNDGTISPYGFGWHIHDREDGKALHHTGSLVGFRNFVFVDLTKRNVVIMLTNGGDSFPLPGMATGITNILSDRPATVPKQSLVDHLYAFESSQPRELRAEVTRVREQEPDRYRIHEGDLNALGYNFLEANRTNEAKAVFEAVIDAFPESSNAYDSYAEALMTAGEYEPAAVNYRKSLELDPENENAATMLQRLEALMSS